MDPIPYDQIQYNHEMEYNNGYIIITQPGWYTCTANTRGFNKDENCGIHIAVEGRMVSYGQSYSWATATTTYSKYLNQFDVVHAQKEWGPTQGHIHDNWFECRMMP